MKRLTDFVARIPCGPWALLLLLLLAARDSQNLLRPEFYAEDGAAWYADAYSDGIASLAIPRAGYLNSVQRLVALVVQPLPLEWAPLVCNLFAYLVYAALLLFLLSPRLDAVWPQQGARRLFALLLVLMPASAETFGVLTNVQWIFAPLAFLVLASRPPAGRAARVFDVVVLSLCAISGPFCLFLLPFAAWHWWREGGRAPALRICLLAGGALLQVAFIWVFWEQRPAIPALGASVENLLKIVALIPLCAAFGERAVGAFANIALWHLVAAPGMAMGLGALLGYAIGWRAGPLLLRQFILFAALMFGAALYRPAVDPHPGLLQWVLMVDHPPAGGRYYFFLLIAWWGVLFACAAQSRGLAAGAARVLLVLTCVVAMPLDWPRWRPDHHDEFQAQARAFEAAAPGTRFVIPVRPAWFDPMVLVKK